MPVLGSSLGIDGGDVFQIAATENLQLTPKAIGGAFGLGVLSVPLQLAAARTPLWRARRNVQVFLVLMAIQCWVLALLVGLDVAGQRIALLALVITVIAETCLSVLYAPAWQPLLSQSLTTKDRQTVNSVGRATGRGLAAAMVITFGIANTPLRTLILLVVGVVAVLLAVAGRQLAAPDRPADRPLARDPGPSARPRIPPAMRRLYVVIGLTYIVGTWPLFLVYANEVLWPQVNLGLLGAVNIGGTLFAAAVWRPPVGDLARRARRAGYLLFAAAGLLAISRPPVTNPAEGVTTFAALTAGAAAAATITMALVEGAHRQVDDRTSVRTFTILDVVGSTSLQVGLLISGLLVAASTTRTGWLLDPYRLYLFVGSAGVSLLLTTPIVQRTLRHQGHYSDRSRIGR